MTHGYSFVAWYIVIYKNIPLIAARIICALGINLILQWKIKMYFSATDLFLINSNVFIITITNAGGF